MKKPSPAPEPAGDPHEVLEACLEKFDAPVARVARAALERLRALTPGATELVYDAYNALSIPFATGEKLGDAFVSVVIYPKHVNLGFLRGAELDDPHGLLQGTGSKIRHLRADAASLADPRVAKLVRAAAELAGYTRKEGAQGPLVIKRIYARQRPRKPGSAR